MLLALAASLLGHALVLSVPLGNLEEHIGTIDTPGSSAGFAPLHVALAPFPLRLPDRSISSMTKTPQAPRTAAAIDSEEEEGDGLPGDASAPPEEKAQSRETAASGLPIPYYFEPQELTQRARILRDIDPSLGELSNQPGIGKAVIALWINEQGAVDRAETESSTLSEAFEHAVLNQFGTARFHPAEREGKPVKSLMKIEVEVLPRSRFSRNAAEENSPTP